MKIFLLFFTTIIMNCSAQQGKYDLILKKLDKNHQFKLDSGEFMLETELEYTMKLDSLMKVIYNDLIVVKKTNVKNIEIEQNKWIKQFDIQIKNIWKPLNESMNEIGFISNDEKMFVFSKKSELTRIRILELINKLNK
ncbi:hypothetical protein [Polaribacter sp. MED152]|uniref:hypothetical protein n=1 Tax=Polaribacter sp. MED152 TaxID=313598 RepID=UPI000068C89A|nr:hypothetical protein [Polaribacter sp. MED152]